MVAVSSQYNRVAIEPQTACHLLSKSGYERTMCGVMLDTFDPFDKLGSQLNHCLLWLEVKSHESAYQRPDENSGNSSE